MRFPPVAPGQVQCPSCGLALATAGYAGVTENFVEERCSRCRAKLLVQIFPSLHRHERVAGAGQLAMEGEATCFFHPSKRAELVCDRCGRFICELCDLPVGARHLCPKCLEAGIEQDVAVPELLRRRVSWGRLSLLVAFLPAVFSGPFFFILFITAPAAIFCAVYGWRRPGSLVHGRRRVSAILGALLSLAEVAALIGLLRLMWLAITRGNHG